MKIKLFIISIVKFFVGFIPKKRNLWLFGAWQGKIYADNTKYMFEYVNTFYPEIESVWISRNINVIQILRKKGFCCYNRYSLMGIICVCRAEVAFLTEGIGDIEFFINDKKTIVVQLWHGVAPKKANWWGDQSRITRQNQYWMVTSEQNRITMKDLVGMPDDHLFITGYPRNDVFVDRKDNSLVISELNKKYPTSKKIIYMPTHRNFGTQGKQFHEEEMLYVDKKLRENNIIMVFKPHFHELKNYLSLEKKLTNIILAKDVEKYSDVYSYIGDFDLLISDYSSIIYDFTCTHKPIVLFPYDLENYREKDAGLLDCYESIPAGPFCYTWNEVLNSVVKLLKNDIWKEKRELCRRIFHPFDDGKNCERVFKCVKEIIQNN